MSDPLPDPGQAPPPAADPAVPDGPAAPSAVREDVPAGGLSVAAARGIYTRALRDMLLLVVVVGVLGVGVGVLVAGSAGVWAAFLGVVLTLVFSGTTVVSMLRTAGSSGSTMAMVVLGGWLAKMVVLVIALAVLGQMSFYDRYVFAAVLLVGVIGAVVLDYRAVRSGRLSYVEPAEGRIPAGGQK